MHLVQVKSAEIENHNKIPLKHPFAWVQTLHKCERQNMLENSFCGKVHTWDVRGPQCDLQCHPNLSGSTHAHCLSTPEVEAGVLDSMVISSSTVSGHPGLSNETMPNNNYNNNIGNKNDKQGMNEVTCLVRAFAVTMEDPAKKANCMCVQS